jgi:hypothetical protein
MIYSGKSGVFLAFGLKFLAEKQPFLFSIREDSMREN